MNCTLDGRGVGGPAHSAYWLLCSLCGALLGASWTASGLTCVTWVLQFFFCSSLKINC